METTFKALFCFSLIVVSINGCPLFGHTADTLIVAANPPGNLNNVINGDTTATGERVNPNRVYVLRQTGTVDTTYFLTEEIRIKDVTLIGINNRNTGFPPVIQPYIRQDGTSVEEFIVTLKEGVISLKNLYLLATRADGLSVTSSAISAYGNSARFVIDGCVFENFGAQGTSNILNTWNAIGSDIFVTNSLFRNNQSNIPENPGINWSGPGYSAIDTAIYKNNTFFILGGSIEGSSSDVGYLEFDHNTIFMQSKGPLFFLLQQSNSVVRNNIFFSVYSTGLDSLNATFNPSSSFGFFCKPAIIMIDTLNYLKYAPYFLTDAERDIVYENNAYFWPQSIIDNIDTLKIDQESPTIGGKIYAPVWAEATVPELLTDRTKWPGINIYTNNENTDPGFDAALVEAVTDSMARFVRHVWENNGDGAGSRPFFYLSKPNNMFEGVPENWAEIQGYPVRENLRYTNQALMTVGTDGLPLGDLNWFPEKIPTTVVIEETNMQPVEFSFSQNYPNPFNPTTKIKYSLPENDFVTLKVFNMLGQVVAVLVNQYKNAGEYVVDFDASNLASGIYVYRIEAGEFSSMKKMVLLR